MIAEPTRRLAPSAYGVWALQQAAFWIVVTIVVLVATGGVDASIVRVLRWLPVLGLLLGITVVPMVRVQHVDTTSHILEQAFDLATVEVHTAAGSHKIPLLEARDADELRRRIEELTDEP